MSNYYRFWARERWWSYVLAIASLICIAIATIYPFNFVVPPDFALSNIFEKFDHNSTVKDYGNNIILFIPLGFGLAGILSRKKSTFLGILVLVTIISFGISLSVEITQVFLPRRVSNFTDVTNNTIGGSIGVFLYWWRKSIVSFVKALILHHRQRLTPRSVGLVFIGYFIVIYLVVFSLLINVNLSNWDDDFPLIIGNEAIGDRPWQGKINQLHISDRALSSPEINTAFREKEVFWIKSGISIASYLFTDFSQLFPNGKRLNPLNSNFNDIFDNDVKLEWRPKGLSKITKQTAEKDDNQSININSDRWLKSKTNASKITQKLKQTNQFSIGTIIATKEIQQSNYPRIISISGNPFYRNLTIAQDKTNLILRLRTPVTGVNGNEPELLIPHVFQDLKFHYIILIFDANKLDIYIDKPEIKYTFNFEPEITLWSYFPVIIPAWQINLGDFNKLFYRLGFYTILLIPLGFLSSILLSFFNHQKIRQLLLLTITCLLPALLIEQLYVNLTAQPIRSFNLLLSITILFLTTLIFKKKTD